MASGVCVVATGTEGAKQLLGINGSFARIEDPVDLAAKISGMLDDESFRKAAAVEAKDRAAKLFDLTRMVEQTEQLYQRILAS